eukprot:TRINITY_DN781840_c0_g1_i1.p1 TRINITY_DN781840_c0_g1~~TRINITY_DN781840_c0_g1_i1.p1  ORF type:complete len:420 (+),score=94.86 TRINITY_DN781840_c0_g1_i1:25-1260(+)
MLSNTIRAAARFNGARSLVNVAKDMTDAELVQIIKEHGGNIYNGDFLRTWDQDEDTLSALTATAMLLKRLYVSGRECNIFNRGLGVSIFRDNSTRTRFSYASAVSLMGLSLQELDEQKSQVAHGETVRETASMISFLTQCIGIRDDMYIHEGHKYMKEVSDALEEGFKEGVLPHRPSVVNLQCDMDHPTQSTADLCHLVDEFGSLENLRGKKIAMTWAYSPSYGKPLSVAQGITTLMTRYGMDVVLAHPEGYDVLPDCVDICKKHAEESGGSFTVTNSMEEAFKDADIVYPKSWAPFHVMEERTKLIREGNKQEELKDLEQRCLENNKKHMDWECDAEKMALTKDGKALYMHCLPADITGLSCEHGEVTTDVFEEYRLRTYHEASHKPYTIASMIAMTRQENLGEFLEECL